MVPTPTRFRHILLILLLLMIVAALPLSASAATTGTITAPANHVTEGSLLQLSTNMSGTVTWTSNSTVTATVNSNGVVTGVKAGQVTITASCPGYTDASITLWVTVPEGVYYLKNASSGLCMETVVDTAYVYTQNTGSATRVSQLWKINYVSNGNYIIRPLGDTSLAMTVGGSGYVTVEKDSSASAGIYWQITHNAFGYAFKHGGSNAETAMPTVNGPTGVPVYPSSWTSSLMCHWELEEIQGVFLRDTTTKKTILPSVVKTVELDSGPVSLANLGLSWECYGNLMGLSWQSSDSSVATVNSSGAITPCGRGQAEITLSTSLNGSTYSSQFSLIVKETINVINLYDSTLSGNSEILAYIDDAVAFLNTVYSTDFYITFTTSSIPELYANTVDQCPLYANAPCSTANCGTSCYNHHKNISRIAMELTSNRWTPNNVIALWSNSPLNTFCELRDDAHTTTSALGVTIIVVVGSTERPLPVAQILSINSFLQGTGFEEYSKECMAIVLAHEIAHTLGLKEIYDNAYGDGADHAGASGMQCIMEHAHVPSMRTLYNQGSDALCDYCRGKLHLEIPSNAYDD